MKIVVIIGLKDISQRSSEKCELQRITEETFCILFRVCEKFGVCLQERHVCCNCLMTKYSEHCTQVE
jgi:hypothetical protein